MITDVMGVLRGARAAVEHDLDLGLPHPRSRLDRGAGARLHARERHGVRAPGHRGGARRRRVRAAALVLLRQPPRLLRGDREVPRRAPHLGAQDARGVRREGSALVDAALPHADCRRVAHGAAAREQHRAHRLRGARGRARGDAVPAHELDGRDARAADRKGGQDRAAHAADHRRGDRGGARRSTRWPAPISSRR